MDIIIRVSPKLSATANHFAKNKEQLVKVCFYSLLYAGKAKRYFILDNCPEWNNLFINYGEVINVSIGNKRESIDYMLDFAREKTTGKNILFLEDDYLWREGVKLSNLEAATEHFGAVTPYDHPDHYQALNKSFLLNVFNNEIWRYCVTTTHTFAITREILNDHFDDLHFGNHDWIMWTKLQIAGVHLFSPVNSYATHLTEGKESVGYNWQERFLKVK